MTREEEDLLVEQVADLNSTAPTRSTYGARETSRETSRGTAGSTQARCPTQPEMPCARAHSPSLLARTSAARHQAEDLRPRGLSPLVFCPLKILRPAMRDLQNAGV